MVTKTTNNTTLDPDDIVKIQDLIKEFMKKMGFKIKVAPKLIPEGETESLVFNLLLKDEKSVALLIGRFGAHLKTLHYFIRFFVNVKMGREIEKEIRFILDVNDYLENRRTYLKKTALRVAREVLQLKEAIEMEPMNAFERRVIHLFLADSKKVATESKGEGFVRRIVIKPL